MAGTSTMDSGAGSALPLSVLLTAGVATAVATAVSTLSICQHLKNYRKPALQRMVIRIMVMVPLYGVSSYISLFSLEAGVIIDVVRDVYEAFVIYCFFHLLLIYLGGERSLLILLYGREPKQHAFPVRLFKRDLDASDPFTFLYLRRGILQYVQVKPVLAALTLLLKALGKYKEGSFRVDAGYLYVSIVYNTSISVSLYCLAMFWVCVSQDLKPFRPMPKFLCVKGILFFSFWQSITVSFFVSIGVIKRLGPYTDVEHISLALTNTLICYEMPLFAIAHSYAFSTTDFTDPSPHHVARMPFLHALRDAFGLLDVLVDARATLRGEVTYKAYEPAEGGMHQGTGRDRRIRAGLRYAAGGRKKYWLPMPADDSAPAVGPFAKARRVLDERFHTDRGYAPLTEDQAADVIHSESSSSSDDEDHFTVPGAFDVQFESRESLTIVRFRQSKREDAMYDDARKLVFGDYNYPVIDCSSEAARARVWEAEEGILRDQRAAAFDPRLGGVVAPRIKGGYGATGAGGGVYGKWAERGDEEGLGQPVGVIDMRDGKQPDMRVAGVDMKWSKSKAGSSSGSEARLRPEPPKHSNLSSASHTPTGRQSPAPGRGRALPPDAVDLVVEDPGAAEARATQDRRKGDPALRTGGKKVYRRGYVLDDGRDVEVSVEEEQGRDGSVDRTTVRVESTDQESGQDEEEPTGDKHGGGAEMVEADTAKVTVTRTGTPPPHAVVFSAGESSIGGNPWA